MSQPLCIQCRRSRSHPVYGERCEDCFAISMAKCYPDLRDAGVAKAPTLRVPREIPMVDSTHPRGGNRK